MQPPSDLTLPVDSTATTRRILSAALKRLLGDLGRLRASDPEVARSLRDVLRVTRAELEREPGRVFGALRRPNVGAAIRVLRDRPGDDAVATQLACTLAVELAVAGAEMPPLAFSRTPARVISLGGRLVLPGGGAATLEGERWTHGEQRVELDVTRALASRAAPADGSLGAATPFHAIEGDLLLAQVDDNPLSMFEAHPDKSGNAIDLGGRSAEAWCDELRASLGVIERYLPLVREEASLVLHQIVPVGYDEQRHLSASYQEAIGTIYLTLHPRRMTMVEALIHELSHNKLNALFEVDAVLENAFHPLFTSPVRPDPRPLHGILLAVHAFLPVAELYRRMIDAGAPEAQRPGFTARYEHILRGNREGAAVLLEHARPTEVGRGLLDEIAALDASFAG